MNDIILKGLSSRYSLSHEEELSGFLRGLRPTAKYLWNAYQSGSVCISYKEFRVQAADMLRYFSHYAEVSRVVLDELHRKQELPFHEELLFEKSGTGRLRVDRDWDARLDRLECLSKLLPGEV
jgi:hypothetical protein